MSSLNLFLEDVFQPFIISYADVAFFVLDTATHRTPQDDPISQWDDLKPGEKTMLGAEQLGALFSWAAKVGIHAIRCHTLYLIIIL